MGRIMYGALIVAALSRTALPTARGGEPKEPGDSAIFFDATTQEVAGTAASGFDGNMTGDWGGERQRLQDEGITIGSTLMVEGFANLRGGVDTAHVVGATTFDLNVALDTGKLFQWQGGEIYADLEDHAFRNPSTALVGDLQIFDKDNTSPYLQIYELWYQQQLFDGKLRVKIGKVDANTEFSLIDNGLVFVNSSSQVSPTIFMMPTTPDPMPSVNAFFTPSDSWYASFGAYYANQSDRVGDLVDDPARSQPTLYGAFLIGETGWKWHDAPGFGRAGNLKVGAWGDTGAVRRFDGTRQDGTWGGYGILDQTIWQPAGEAETGRGVRTFLDFGATQNNINPIDRQFGGGVTWTGAIDERPQDIVGFGPTYAHISSRARLPHAYELAVEAFYQWQLTPWAFVQPDVQYIVHPGGTHPDAVVGTLRVQITF